MSKADRTLTEVISKARADRLKELLDAGTTLQPTELEDECIKAEKAAVSKFRGEDVTEKNTWDEPIVQGPRACHWLGE